MMMSRMDLLSQILTLIRLRGELILSSELTTPWAMRFDAGPAYFHVVSEGEVLVDAGDGAPITAVTGDLLMLAQGRGHVIGTPGAAPASAQDLIDAQVRDDSLVIRHGGGGAMARLVTGAFRFEGDNMPAMLDALPPVIHIPKAVRTEDAGWLEGLAYFLLAEAHAPHPGAALMISRLIDVLVIRTLRTWVRTAPPEATGWLGALSDMRIGRALKAVHDRPFERWSVADLASVAGMSRSSFAERFTALVGEAPLHYQTRWRLGLAQAMLLHEDLRVGDVARRIGYESEAAFSRAFKARFGIAPGLARSGAQ